MPSPTAPPAPRLASIDAYRGLVMLLMLGEVLQLRTVAKALPGSEFWSFLAFHQSHVEWVGCSLHDLIQPSFSFLVGVSLPFSIAARTSRGQSRLRMTLHAFWRAAVLVALGVFLRSIGKPQTNYTFEDTLSQIGLGYGLLFLIGLGPPRLAWASLGIILVGYWTLFALYPAPGPDFPWTSVGVPADWQHHVTGFAAHWDKNSNAAWAFDPWFLNLFPRAKPFEFNGGGYATLSFVPTLATMVLGLIAGRVLQSDRAPWAKVRWLVVAGVVGLAIGYALGLFGVCPVVKRIWTPSWVLFSGGWCFLFLVAFFAVLDTLRRPWLGFPLVVVGANSIVAYCMEWTFAGFVRDALKRHLGAETFQVFGKEYEPLLLGGGVLLVLWLILLWLYRRRVFVRI